MNCTYPDCRCAAYCNRRDQGRSDEWMLGLMAGIPIGILIAGVAVWVGYVL